MVSINRHIYFLLHFIILAFRFTPASDAAPAFEKEFSSLLLHKAYHDGAIQYVAIEISHDSGIKPSFVSFRLGDNLRCLLFRRAGNRSRRQKPEDDFSQSFLKTLRQNSLNFGTCLK